MKRLVNFLGTLAFWFSWPIIHISVRLRPRTRILVVCKQEVLVVMDLVGPGRWSLPGGGLHRSETALTGALRELREETGLKLGADQLTSHGTFATVNDERHRYQYHYFTVELPNKPAITRQKLELRDAQWRHYQDLIDDTRTGSLVRKHLLAWFGQ